MDFKTTCLLDVCSLDRIQAGVANLCASHVKWTIEAHTLLVRATVLATLSEHLQGDLIVALGGKAFATLCFPHREADITPSDNDDAEPGPCKLARLFKVKKPLLSELDLPLAARIGILLDLFRTRIVPQIAFTDEKGRAFFHLLPHQSRAWTGRVAGVLGHGARKPSTAARLHTHIARWPLGHAVGDTHAES